MAVVIPIQEPKPGKELLKQRIRVSFDFDVVCNDAPVRNLSYDCGGTMSEALLRSFLVADKAKLLEMMVEAIGTQLGMHSCETFMHEFLPRVNANSRKIFKPAIEALEGDEKRYWHEQVESHAETVTNEGRDSVQQRFDDLERRVAIIEKNQAMITEILDRIVKPLKSTSGTESAAEQGE